MYEIRLMSSAIEELVNDPDVKQWAHQKSDEHVPFLGYYYRSYSTSRDGTITEHGDGFSLATINPHDTNETKGIVIKPVAVIDNLSIFVGGEASIMSRSFSIDCVRGKFTYEPAENEMPLSTS